MAEQDNIYIENAGLVILHPFLAPLFDKLELYKDGEWTSGSNHQKAVLLTQYLVTGTEQTGEDALFFNKILCGFLMEEAVNTRMPLSEPEIDKCNSLLSAVLEHWKPLNRASLQTLRETFLIRKGKMKVKAGNIELWVEQKGVDVLLEQLPWGIGWVHTPWMADHLHCYWN
jgi:hypothetical protein